MQMCKELKALHLLFSFFFFVEIIITNLYREKFLFVPKRLGAKTQGFETELRLNNNNNNKKRTENNII